MNVVARAVVCSLFALSILPPALSAQTVVATNTPVRVMSANLNGNSQKYEPFALRIFQGLKPDVVAIQEFNYTSTNGVDVNTPAAFREMIDIAFGGTFTYFRENYTGSGDIPNGIISRYPIVSSGSWADPYVSNRGFAWAQIDLPGTNNLYVVSVHLLTSSATARANEAAALKPLIQGNFPANAWIVLAGDFNTDSRTEAAMVTFDSFLSDNPVPTDAQVGGNSNTSQNRNHPHDYVLPSFSYTNALTNAVFPSHIFTNGLVFDSTVYTPLTDVAPVLYGDSTNAQHMAVLKDFLVPYSVTNAPVNVPSIVTQPQSQTLEPGNSATFAVVAGGAPTLAYQWCFNGGSVDGATGSSYTRLNVQPPDAGSYSVIVTNSYGSVTSSVATLSVGTAPAITAQPQSVSTNAGVTVVFNVTATGTQPLAFQWRFNGGDVPGATDSSYSRQNVQAADAGSYSVLVTNIAGGVTSSVATLTIDQPPTITSQPQSLTNFVGQDATFSVIAAGAAPLSYQWRFNGSDIATATGTSYTRSVVQLADAGSYAVVVANAFGSLTSFAAILTVNVQPTTGIIAQWNFNSPTADGTATTGTLAPSTGAGTASYVGGTLAAGTGEFASGSSTDPNSTDNSAWNTSTYPAPSTANKSAGVQFNVSTAGKQNISIRWDERASNTGSKYARLQYCTNGTAFYDFPTAVSVAGTTFEAKTNDLSALPDINNNPNFAFRIVAEFQSTAASGSANYAGAGGTYASSGTLRFDMVTVSGSVIPPATPPGITSHPQSQAVYQGANATFSVLASGTGLNYQWRFNSSDLSGATESSYTRSNVQPAHMGSYSVVITNSAGATNSSNAVLSLVVPAPFLRSAVPGLILWQGLSNLPYTVQAKTNLDEANWLPIGTASSPTSDVSYTDQNISTQRFYRVVYP